MSVTASDDWLEADSDAVITAHTTLPWAVCLAAVAIVVGLFVCVMGGVV